MVKVLFRKCRFDKCLSVGLLPYLVNSKNRNSKRNKKSLQMKQTSSEQEIQVFRSDSQNTTPTIQILLSSASILDDTLRIRPKDLFDNGLILEKISQVYEEVYFNEIMDENLALYCKLIESIGEYFFNTDLNLKLDSHLIRSSPDLTQIVHP